jgi:antitoxin ParD1/3/4
MDEPARLSIELPQDLADAVRARVASGDYSSESEMIQEGLELLADRERTMDAALRAELAAGYDEWKADPSAVHTADDIREHLRKRRRRHG